MFHTNILLFQIHSLYISPTNESFIVQKVRNVNCKYVVYIFFLPIIIYLGDVWKNKCIITYLDWSIFFIYATYSTVNNIKQNIKTLTPGYIIFYFVLEIIYNSMEDLLYGRKK